MKKSFADILSDIDSGTERKVSKKIPGWLGAEIPSALSLEQCSSEAAADYKRRLLAGRLPGGIKAICDLTCGLGVDSLALSRAAERVVSFERSAPLAEAARGNFHRFGADNIEVRCQEVGPGTTLPECDVFYADPARRDGTGRKVFRLEDCSPDIRPLLPALLEKSSMVLLKLSPMADISLLAGVFGQALREVHIVSLHSEVKELLCILESGGRDSCRIHVVDLDSPGEEFSFTPEEENDTKTEYASGAEAGEYLHEPCAALLKSGAFHLTGERFGLKEADKSTRLYLSDSPVNSPLIRTFLIEHALPMNGEGLREARKLYPCAGVSARNVPVSSETLRGKLKVGEDPRRHIFGCSVAGRRTLLLCRRLAEQVARPEDMV